MGAGRPPRGRTGRFGSRARDPRAIGPLMRILKIFDGDYPWDVRVEKFLHAFERAGHEVTLLARNRQKRPRRERLGGVEIRRLPHPGPLEPLIGMPFFFQPHWAAAAVAAARECRPDRIVVRDLPLAPLGVWLARRLGVPSILDLAEPYPEALRSMRRFGDVRGVAATVRSPRLAEAVERWLMRRASRVLVVAEEAGERLERCGLPEGRWTLVRNTPELDRVRRLAERPLAVEPDADAACLLFTGILAGDRGLEVAMQALARLLETGREASLLIVGDGKVRRALEESRRRLGLEARVRLAGARPYEDLPALWAAADVGLLPFHRCSHIDHTLANKLFEYMAVGLPVVASDAPPMVRVLEETGSGRTFRGGDPGDLARAVAAVLDDPVGAREMRERARKAAETTYAWRYDAERLVRAVESP